MAPTVELVAVEEDDKAVVANLLQLYCYDFAEIRDYPIGRHGTYRYRYLDHYFVEDGREAWLLRCDGELVGFVLARRLDDEPDPDTWEVAEFFVLRRDRRGGVGRAAATAALRRHPGPWLVAFDVANHEAAAFWPGVVASVAAGEVARTDEPGRYPRQELRFEVADVAVGGATGGGASTG